MHNHCFEYDSAVQMPGRPYSSVYADMAALLCGHYQFQENPSGRVTSNKLCDKYDNAPCLNVEFSRCIVIPAFSDIDTHEYG